MIAWFFTFTLLSYRFTFNPSFAFELHFYDMKTVNILMGTDEAGFEPNATVLASIARRSSLPVHGRFYFRGESLPCNFAINNLIVEFFEPKGSPTAEFPDHVTQPAMDRLLGIRDFDDWDSALVMDYDQLCFADLSELFDDFDFEGQLLAGRFWGRSIADAAREWFGRALPVEYLREGEGDYFYMGPLLNLSLMRQENTWDRFLEVHEKLEMEEQLSLAVACEGRVKELEPKWNSVPDWDQPMEPLNCILHFTMPAKPWNCEVNFGSFWFGEKISWSDLREGHWGRKDCWIEIGESGIRVPRGNYKLSDFMASQLKNGWYENREREILPHVIRRGDRVLELGTGVGVIAVEILKILKEKGAYLGFEADPVIAEVGRQTLDLNDVASGIAEIRSGVLGRVGSETFYRREHFWGSSLTLGTEEEAIEVASFDKSVVLREFCPTVLVIDIEGGEFSLLQNWDFSGVERILIEIHQFALGKNAVSEIRLNLKKQGFEVAYSEGNGEVSLWIFMR
jgi:lipopolysaccharide biosynthesis glycosyltransferase